MGASIYGDVDGASRKAKELYAKVGGVNRKIKREYAKVNGVVRKVYSGYQCQGESLGYGTIREDGSFSFDIPDNHRHDLFHIHFYKPKTFTNGESIKFSPLEISSAVVSNNICFDIYSDANHINILRSYCIDVQEKPEYNIAIFPFEGSYQDLYFSVMSELIGVKVTGYVTPGDLYINGEQITSVELI